MIGRIYIIKSKQTNKVYIGSTVETLKKRFSKHKCSKTCSSREILKYDDAKIELLECYECENKEELRKKEGEYIRKYDCVNKKIEGRTDKEYRQENKEKIAEYYQENKEAVLEYQKEYYEKNKEKINEKFTCPCGGTYTYQNKARHLKTKMHLNYLGK